MDNLVHFTKNSISEFNDRNSDYSTKDDSELIEVMNSQEEDTRNFEFHTEFQEDDNRNLEYPITLEKFFTN
ncbi:hypothetical protein F8M41_006072 [Gigaspora margarita]|uniref:Uncharacterized protein n=1 Tax=Gigaspora margarita TaxID=4874 RepID=A0A8H4A4F4_GIGMA|nr:hypothetical protein F8M41_006072 [Gigaspora margarita]